MKTAILGWGSLLWDCDKSSEFENQHEDWQFDGPCLKLEFSRISCSRGGALTLVIDEENGQSCQVAYALSRREDPADARHDLKCREGAKHIESIGFCNRDGSDARSNNDKVSLRAIQRWAKEKVEEIDAVVWTALPSNFEVETGKAFNLKSAISYLKCLNDFRPRGMNKAVEYVCHAPYFIDTRLRRKLQKVPWFPKHNSEE